MSFRNQIVSVAALLALASLFVPQQSVAQNSTNPYAIVEGWAKLPGGRVMGAVGKAKVDPDGRPSGIAFDNEGRIYVADSESDNVQNPGYEMGIRIGEAETGWVKEFIRFPSANPNILPGNGAEFVTVDSEGNIY